MSNIREYLREKRKRDHEVNVNGRPDAGERRDTRERFEAKIFKHKMSTALAALAVILFIAVVAIFVILQWRNRIYSYYETVATTEREVVNGTTDVRLGSAILTYSRDGAHCTDTRGNVRWNQTYQIQEVVLDICQDTAVLASYNGRDVYVVNSSEILGNFSTTLPIRNVAVAANGTVAVVMADTEVTYYCIYTPDGEMQYKGMATMASSGYPLWVSLSPNGILLEISYIYLDAGVQKTNVAFYNLGDVGASKTDFFVGAYNYDLFVPFVHFMNDNTCFAVGDSQLMLYRGNQVPTELAKIPYTDEVKSVFYNEQYIGLVFYADDGNSLYKMDVYDASGKQKGSYYFAIEYTDIFFHEDQFVVYNESECEVITLDNVVKYNGTFEKSVGRMIPMAGPYRYLIVTGDSMDVIQLR